MSIIWIAGHSTCLKVCRKYTNSPQALYSHPSLDRIRYSILYSKDKSDMPDSNNNNDSESETKPLFLRPRDWPKDLVDPKKPFWTGIKNPLAWIVAILLFPILLYLREYF